jgi:hypothetical protein
MKPGFFSGKQQEDAIINIIKEYFEVYVESNFNRLFSSLEKYKNITQTEKERIKNDILQYLKKATQQDTPLSEQEHNELINSLFNLHLELKPLAQPLMYHKKLISGSLSEQDDLIRSLTKAFPTIPVDYFNRLISKEIINLTQNYLNTYNKPDKASSPSTRASAPV